MNVALLKKLFPGGQWSGPCTIVLEAGASLLPTGPDTVQGGTKIPAPRAVSGRIQAEAVCLPTDSTALLVVQQQKIRMATGGDVYKQSLTVVDAESVVAIEFADIYHLTTFGVPIPVVRTSGSSHGSDTGTQTRPK